MPRVAVTVTKSGFQDGVIIVEAESENDAQAHVNAMMASGELQTVDERISWNTDDYQYLDGSFQTIDAEEVGD